MNIRRYLFELKDENYKNFSSKLTKTKYPLIGVRIPLLKKIAKDVSKENYTLVNSKYFEEIMLEGLSIGYLKDIDEVIEKLKSFIGKIDDWSVCDSLCANLRITKKNKDEMWSFITSFKNSDKEFELRFMIVMMMNYFIDTHLLEIFKILDNIKYNFYYSNMAMAWFLATSLAKKESETLLYLKSSNVNDFVYNKTISKACESYRISFSLKEKLRKMKR